MFAALVRNILITGVAYFIISAIGLLMAPILIASYGLAGYGQILLARLPLPSASFGLFDLGIGENATRAIATTRPTNDNAAAGKAISLLLVLATVLGFVVGAALFAAAPLITEWLNIEPEGRAGFVAVLRLTALLEPLLFLTLVSEGILRGFEAFRKLRGCEILSALLYGSLGIGAVFSDLGPNNVAVALLIGLVARAVVAGFFAIGILRGNGVRLTVWDYQTRDDIARWSGTMLYSKALGIIQTQMSSPLLGILIGPSAVGLFDSIARVPRFIKSAFGLINTTALPLGARLLSADDRQRSQRLGRGGIAAALMIAAPPIVMLAAFSEPVLFHWLGSAISSHWMWLAMFMAVPLLNVPRGFAGTLVAADRACVNRLNVYTLIQSVLQLVLSVALLSYFTPWSFVIGEVVSLALLFPLQMRVIAMRIDLRSDLVTQCLAAIAIALVVAGGLYLLLPEPSPIVLLAILLLGPALIWFLYAFLLLPRALREHAIRAFLGLFRAAPDDKLI
ncbi:lipopolysaccharide biosynthesis protein [Qipengyuania oceanensis]|uniref:Oligosaccharide flippase family protein n=1 Tax=Qipengyuania oceanensis TaxID=1463597 RepID=A0A844YJ84_9SPHN|nr:oligosaccharide flippase family protein [Qipengyuania oceanensis]MXO63108.1 hypothetical protein [Qipengyuania oceanensis]